MHVSASGSEVGRRFRTGVLPMLCGRMTFGDGPTLVKISRDAADGGFTLPAPFEEAYAVHVLGGPLSSPRLVVDGRDVEIDEARSGSTFLFDLERGPVARFSGHFLATRFFMSKKGMRHVARENDLRWTGHLTDPGWGRIDAVLAGLFRALGPSFQRPDDANSLFVDHVILAAHVHLVSAYGGATAPDRLRRGGLAPSQLRRVQTVIAERISEDLSLSALAAECGLSAGYFARAFRVSTGLSPHRFHTAKRIELAKTMILASRPLSEVSIACGFSDQSHLTRVFSTIVGATPGAWRKTLS